MPQLRRTSSFVWASFGTDKVSTAGFLPSWGEWFPLYWRINYCECIFDQQRSEPKIQTQQGIQSFPIRCTYYVWRKNVQHNSDVINPPPSQTFTQSSITVEAGIFATMIYSVLLKVGKNVLKMMETLRKNSLITAKYVRVIHVYYTVIAITFSGKKWEALLSYRPSHVPNTTWKYLLHVLLKPTFMHVNSHFLRKKASVKEKQYCTLIILWVNYKCCQFTFLSVRLDCVIDSG
jgi:hypothetical protein